jgi:glycosyltransferase involved in cell wall biosynthesis
VTLTVAHLTSVHQRHDSRIFLKQCRGLAAGGFDVSLVVADGLGNAREDGVSIIDVGRTPGRLNRMVRASRGVCKAAAKLNADIYHLHDPELLPFGLLLKRRGKTVVYDAHEDVPKQLLAKPYLGPRRLRALADAYAVFERYAARRLDGIIAATPSIGEKFRALNARTAVVNNYPLVDELYGDGSWERKTDTVCYIGGISAARGIRELVAAMDRVTSPARLALAGSFSGAELESEIRSMPGWARTDYLGYLDRGGIRELLGRSVAGLVTLHPTPNHLESHPIKLFEYMSAGIPAIASDFPLWRRIIEDADCGYCVDPADVAAIAECIDRLVADREEARRLGENGRNAILRDYNWPNEEQALREFYESLAEATPAPELV